MKTRAIALSACAALVMTPTAGMANPATQLMRHGSDSAKSTGDVSAIDSSDVLPTRRGSRKPVDATSKLHCTAPSLGGPVRLRVRLKGRVPKQIKRGSSFVLRDWRATIRIPKRSVKRLKRGIGGRRIGVILGAGSATILSILTGKGRTLTHSVIDRGKDRSRLRLGRPTILRLAGKRVRVDVPRKTGHRVWLRLSPYPVWWLFMYKGGEMTGNVGLECNLVGGPARLGYVRVRG